MLHGIVEVPDTLLPVAEEVARCLSRVSRRFDAQLASDLPPVERLCAHVERYRGKMLRPTLVLLSGLAAAPQAALREEHIVIGAVCEMVHMATLVHDDVLDEADMRRRGETVNRLHGNEAAVILGDYLIASAYHLCSAGAGPEVAEEIGRASMVMCAGELLQLHHRRDWSLDEATYTEIVGRKTAELIASACWLGAGASGAPAACREALRTFGKLVGLAFQIQDDLLDLLGSEGVVGKSVGKDLDKGKLTLPLLHHLREADPSTRARTLRILDSWGPGSWDSATPRQLREALVESGSLTYTKAKAEGLIAAAQDALKDVPDSPARATLSLLADAVVTRSY